MLMLSCISTRHPTFIRWSAQFSTDDEVKFKSFKEVKAPKQWAFAQKKKSQLDTIPLEWNRAADTVIYINYSYHNGYIYTKSTFFSNNDSLTITDNFISEPALHCEKVYSRASETFDEEDLTPLYSAIRAWDMDSVNAILRKSTFPEFDGGFINFCRIILQNDSIISMESYTSLSPMWITKPY